MKGWIRETLFILVFRMIGWIFRVSAYTHRALETDPSSQGLPYEDISFYTRKRRNRVLLRGWYIPSGNSNKCIIMVHGWGGHRAQSEIGMLEMAKEIVNRGYNVLTFDLRAHGESKGDKISFGYYETYDVLGAYDFVVNKKNIPPQNIGLLGFSYGAMIVILAARKENVGAVVVDSCPANLFILAKREMARLHIPFFPLYAAKWITKVFFGIDAKEINAEDAVKEISTPIFCIHGTKDSIPYVLAQRLYRLKKRNPLDRIWISDACHNESYKTYPEKYLKKLIGFFNQALKTCSK